MGLPLQLDAGMRELGAAVVQVFTFGLERLMGRASCMVSL